jgi:hypothetical protein
MITYSGLLAECQGQAGDDSSTTSNTLFTKGINQGLHLFRAALRREYTLERKTFSVVADQQFYQMPEDAVRADKIIITIGGIAYPLTEIADDNEWYRINAVNGTSSEIPEFFYIRGQDEFGIYPTPASSVASGGEIVYQARVGDLGVADYTTGTIAVTSGDATVTGSGTTFTAKMVNRHLRIDDGSSEAIWYKIDTYTDSTHVELENVFGGTTGSGLSYIIGELPNIPEEYHLNLADHGLYRYYLRRRDKEIAAMFKAEFEIGLQRAKREYSSKTVSNYIPGRRRATSNNLFTKEPNEVT